MIWRLRRASIDDAPAVAALARTTFLATFASLLPAGDMAAHCDRNSSAERFAEWARDTTAVLVVAEERAGLVGYSLLTSPDLPVATTPSDIELRRIYALASSHGTGLGPALMAQAIMDAQDRGCMRVLLGVHGDNLRARAFYKAQGFDMVGERRFQVGGTWCEDLVYARAV